MGDTNKNTALDTEELEKTLNLIRQIKKEFKDIDSESKSINSNINKYNQVIRNGFINMPKGADKVLASSMKDISKIAPDIARAFMGTSAGQSLSNTQVFKNIVSLSGALNKALPVIALVTTALTAMTAAGAKANETTINITRSLKQLGGDLGEISEDALNSSNKMAIAKNRVGELGYALESLFTPLINMVSETAYWLTGIVDKIDGTTSKGTGTTKLSQETLSELQALSEVGLQMQVPESSALVASIVSQAQQAGIDKASATKMALRTLAEANNIASEFGKAEEVGTVAQQLASAWLKGDGSASEYGIVTNNDALVGYMAMEKGIDAVNTKFTDGAMMAYRFELAMESASKAGSEELQDRVKGWIEEANAIKAAQNQLLGFEEVVSMRAVDNSIPLVDYDGVVKGVNNQAENEVKIDVDTDEAKDKIRELVYEFKNVPRWIETSVVISQSTVPFDKSITEGFSLFKLSNTGKGLASASKSRGVADYVNSSSVASGNIWTNLVGDYRDWYGNVNPLMKVATDWIDNTINSWLTGHYDGGISTRAHLAKISEHNSTEAIIPLNNPSAIPAFDRIGESIADRLAGSGNGGSTANTYNLAPGGVVIADNYSVDRFVELIANKMATLNRDRGDMSYGIR